MGRYLQSIKNQAKLDFKKKPKLKFQEKKKSFILAFSPKQSICSKEEEIISKEKQVDSLKKALENKRQQKLQ